MRLFRMIPKSIGKSRRNPSKKELAHLSREELLFLLRANESSNGVEIGIAVKEALEKDRAYTDQLIEDWGNRYWGTLTAKQIIDHLHFWRAQKEHGPTTKKRS